LRLCVSFTPALVGLEGPVRCGPGMVGPPEMDHEENQHESDQQELVKQQVRCHDDVLFHGDEKGQFYRIGPLLNYALDGGTPPNFRTPISRRRHHGHAHDTHECVVLTSGRIQVKTPNTRKSAWLVVRSDWIPACRYVPARSVSSSRFGPTENGG